MKFSYTAVFSIKGLILDPTQGEKLLLVDTPAGLRAILRSQPDSHVFEGDRSLAVAGLILRSIFNSEPTEPEFKQRVASSVEELRLARHKEYGSNPFLLVIGEGEVTSFSPTHERDTEDFIVCFEGADKDEIRARFRDKLNALLISLISEADSVIGLKRLTDHIVFFQDDGKPVYSYTFSGGAVSAYVS